MSTTTTSKNKKRSRSRMSKNPVLFDTSLAPYISMTPGRHPSPSIADDYHDADDATLPDVQINILRSMKPGNRGPSLDDSDSSDGDFIPPGEEIEDDSNERMYNDTRLFKPPKKQRKIDPNLLITRAKARARPMPPAPAVVVTPPPQPVALVLPPPAQDEVHAEVAKVDANPVPTTATIMETMGSRLMTKEQVQATSLERFEEFVLNLGDLSRIEARMVSAQRRRIYNRLSATKSRASHKERLERMDEKLETLSTNMDSMFIMLITLSQKVDSLINFNKDPFL